MTTSVPGDRVTVTLAPVLSDAVKFKGCFRTAVCTGSKAGEGAADGDRGIGLCVNATEVALGVIIAVTALALRKLETAINA